MLPLPALSLWMVLYLYRLMAYPRNRWTSAVQPQAAPGGRIRGRVLPPMSRQNLMYLWKEEAYTCWEDSPTRMPFNHTTLCAIQQIPKPFNPQIQASDLTKYSSHSSCILPFTNCCCRCCCCCCCCRLWPPCLVNPGRSPPFSQPWQRCGRM